jgi:hypothetical protein
MKVFFLIVLLPMLFACASKPKLSTNEKWKKIGEKGATQDVERCMAEAEKHAEKEFGDDADFPELRKTYTNQCLVNEGYEVSDWD